MMDILFDGEKISQHESVNGHIILLRKRTIGKSVCVEYTVQKENLPLYKSGIFHLLSVSVLLLSVSAYASSLLGILFFALLGLILFYILFWDVEKEVLLVTVPLGLQFTSFFKSGQQTTCYIPWHCVKDVYIIETVSFHRVLYNLVVLTQPDQDSKQSSQKLIPLFQGTKPRISCLEKIYQGIYDLFPEENSKI
ncbi:phosphatidylinositol N-acetylglucosaminyltransferase subunit H-like [Thrips palmi]|uniref:Phosphatidylinositol N-acetylglucosaminyltransferase subunit H-like n=1 Tax=Thrips palmi TaxID=161013 RepID=A0A6P8ZXC6_THRPL|nr:phosphatidylinositol N-acetylglucosaminyltransferase subunit H-like [Thrips palmi]XP_034250058.1 phosphatidylinositol N-acetylglucosaminyltransferase subunit H-like [Thrips palmi]